MMVKNYELRVKRVKVREPEAIYGVKVTGPEAVVHMARELFGREAQEVFAVFFLDTGNYVLGYSEAARGGIDSCVVDPRVVLRGAIVVGATSIIVVHNHPSGNLSPSSADRALTKRLQDGCEIVGVAFLDHIIVTDSDSLQMARW